MGSLLADVHLAYQVLGRVVAADLREAAVSMSESLVLRVVTINPRVTASELREVTGLRHSTLASLISRLEERHYVQRRQLAGDLRYTVVRPTLVGAAVGRMVESSLDAIENRLASQVTPDDRAGIALLATGLATIERPEPISPLD
jgi:DNA-binding MarR family transcriptional regulator